MMGDSNSYTKRVQAMLMQAESLLNDDSDGLGVTVYAGYDLDSDGWFVSVVLNDDTTYEYSVVEAKTLVHAMMMTIQMSTSGNYIRFAELIIRNLRQCVMVLESKRARDAVQFWKEQF
jgi:hypothetical protein